MPLVGRAVLRILVPLTLALAVAGATHGQRFLCEPIHVGTPGPRGIPEFQREEGAATAPVTIDLMLLYSPAAIEQGIHGYLNRTLEDANDIFWNSGTGIILRLAGLYSMNEESRLAQAVQQVEASDRDTWSEPSSELLRLTKEHAGVDSVRREIGADIVVVWTGVRDWAALGGAGRAYAPSSGDQFNRTLGFAALHSGGRNREGTADLLAHELGHNLGLHHHPGAPDRNRGESLYLAHGQGYLGRSSSLDRPYMTVMGTWAGATEPRYEISRFSSDGFHTWRGARVRIGDRNHRAADVAAATAPFVAAYERSTLPPPEPPRDEAPEAPSNLTATAVDAKAVRLTWVDRSDNEKGFELHFRSAGRNWSQLDEPTEANRTWTRLTWEEPPSVRTWSFRVRAFNDAGGTYSNTVTVTLPDPNTAPPPPGCPADRACLSKEGFQVFVSFWSKDQWNRASRLTTANVGESAAVFYFFSADNPELLVKVANGCSINGHWWVYGSAATDLYYHVQVVAEGGDGVSYQRGPQRPLIADSKAIPCE